MITRVISGGQIGADIAALRAAYKLGVETGGWMPLGYKTLTGRMSDIDVLRYDMQMATKPGYPVRTEYNVRDSDATISIAVSFTTPGEICTRKMVEKYKRPYQQILLHPSAQPMMFRPMTDSTWLTEWLNQHNVKVLNVAGSAKISIEAAVEDYVTNVLKRTNGLDKA